MRWLEPWWSDWREIVREIREGRGVCHSREDMMYRPYRPLYACGIPLSMSIHVCSVVRVVGAASVYGIHLPFFSHNDVRERIHCTHTAHLTEPAACWSCAPMHMPRASMPKAIRIVIFFCPMVHRGASMSADPAVGSTAEVSTAAVFAGLGGSAPCDPILA